MPTGLKRGIDFTFVASGDYIDTAEEDGLRVASTIPVIPLGGGTTTIKAIDGGTGTIGDGVSATGSTATVTFTTTFTANPIVAATIVGWTNGLAAYVGSQALICASRDTGSAVFLGPSGAGFHWIAYGSKY